MLKPGVFMGRKVIGPGRKSVLTLHRKVMDSYVSAKARARRGRAYPNDAKFIDAMESAA